MKKNTVIILVAVLAVAALELTNFAQTRWHRLREGNFEYACFMYSGGSASWTSSQKTISAKTILDLHNGLGITGWQKPTPPEFPVLSYAGDQGWELVDVCCTGDSDTYWFIRPK